MSYQTSADREILTGSRVLLPIANEPCPSLPTELPQRGVRGIESYSTVKVIWHQFFRRRKVLPAAPKLPARMGTPQPVCLSLVDAVSAFPEPIGELGKMGFTTSRIAALGWLADNPALVARSGTRSGLAATRIVYMGELSPRSGAAEFQGCAIAWAEQFPERKIEILWLGQGDLRGVLHAQILPTNFMQSFADIPPPDSLGTALASYGLFVLPGLSPVRSPFIAEAMAAGLPVLGSIHSAQARALVTPNQTGWLFDPFHPATMFAALDAALTLRPDRLDVMREAAISRIREVASKRGSDSVDRGVLEVSPSRLAMQSSINA